MENELGRLKQVTGAKLVEGNATTSSVDLNEVQGKMASAMTIMNCPQVSQL